MFVALRSRLRHFLVNQAGNVAITTALSLPVIAVAVGGAIDVHRAVTARSVLSDILDASVLAAARDSDTNSGARLLDGHMEERLASISWESDFTTPETGRYRGDLTAQVPTYFLGLIGMNTMTLTLSAEAVKGGGRYPCVTLMDPNAGQALLINSGARLIAPNCEIHVHSTGHNAAVFNAGSRLETSRVCIRSDSVLDNGGRPDDLQTGCTPNPDPFAGRLPEPASTHCTRHGGSIDRGPVNLTPGVYCGGLNFNGRLDVNFAPGVYVIKGGDWNVNGGVWRGEGVTFYFDDSSRIQFNSGINADLAAPTSGPYRDILFFERPNLPRSHFIFNDSAGNRLDGVMYLPSRNMIYNSGSDARGDRLAMVFNTLIINQATWRIDAVESASGDSAPRLVR